MTQLSAPSSVEEVEATMFDALGALAFFMLCGVFAACVGFLVVDAGGRNA